MANPKTIRRWRFAAMASCALGFAGGAHAQAFEPTLAERIARLEQDNHALRQQVAALQPPVATPVSAPAVAVPASPPPDRAPTRLRGRIDVAPDYGFATLDHRSGGSDRVLNQLAARADGDLAQVVTFSGQATVIANVQRSNRPSKFGYLMRNPTSANQIGEDVSEALIHSANLAVTANVAPSVMAYLELLYAPQQSMGAGTITALTRNQIEMRRAYLLFGDLERTPFYAAIGKLDVPFGENDTVNPFTNSTNWHAFAALAYGAKVGYAGENWHIQAMAVQGGAQFRSANVAVEGTAVPSRLNNFAVDAEYRMAFGDDGMARVGASYLHGSAYCQAYPIFHFNPCPDRNPAWAAYGNVSFGGVTLMAEYAQTLEEWPGTQVPDPTNVLARFDAVQASAFTLGARYGFGQQVGAGKKHAVSVEYSRFTSGDEGAPWERQDQLVIGYSAMISPHARAFGEYIRVNGFAPLNFLSGGNLPGGATWSDRDAKTDVLLVGLQVGF